MSMQFDLRRVLVLGVLTLALGALAGCSSQPQNMSPELESAKKLINEGHYEAALMRLNQALIQAPRDPNVHLNLGWLYLYTDDPEHAEMELKKAESLAPDLAESYHLRGALQSYRAQHQLEGTPRATEELESAVANFKKALSKDDKNYQTYFDLATSLNLLNRSEEALAALDKGFTYIPSNELETQVNFQIASCSAHAKLQQFDEAIADCKQAAEFTENKTSKQRIADMIENMRLLNPQIKASPAESGPTPEEEQKARESNVIQGFGTD
jgi:tetratricopeptide (TPR) repeat protein